MRYLILVLLCAFNLTASAQWWRGDFKKHPRLALISPAKSFSAKRIPKPVVNTKLPKIQFPRTAYNLEVCEKLVIKDAQHHMRFREYALASYDFSALGELYVLENRLSEAKWYYLQSILLSKRQEDFQHTIASLISLAMIKADLGDQAQAQQDLAEARTLALNLGRLADVTLIDKKINYVKNNKIWLPKADLRYAENAELPGKIK